MLAVAERVPDPEFARAGRRVGEHRVGLGESPLRFGDRRIHHLIGRGALPNPGSNR